MELYVSSVLSTKVEMTDPRKSAEQNTLWVQAGRFADASRRLGQLHGKTPWPCRVIRDGASLSAYGCARAAGLSCRPWMPNHEQAELQIAKWLDAKIKMGINLSKGHGLWRWNDKFSFRGTVVQWCLATQKLARTGPRRRIRGKQPDPGGLRQQISADAVALGGG